MDSDKKSTKLNWWGATGAAEVKTAVVIWTNNLNMQFGGYG